MHCAGSMDRRHRVWQFNGHVDIDEDGACMTLIIWGRESGPGEDGNRLSAMRPRIGKDGSIRSYLSRIA